MGVNDTDLISSDYSVYSDESEDDFFLSIYDSIRDSSPDILTAVERRYKSHKQHHHEDLTPLLSLVTQEPHSMTIMMKPSKMEPESQVRLLYERVPAHRRPNRTHLDHPVMDFVPIIRNSQTYVIKDLPRGKYIVCGEALNQLGDVFQESCFETKIKREETEDLQIGVKALIIISITVVLGVLIYNVVYQVRSIQSGYREISNVFQTCRTRGKVKRQEKKSSH